MDDDLDALMNDLYALETTHAATPAAQPNPVDDLDALMSSLGGGSSAPTSQPARSAPPTHQTVAPANDLDDLEALMGSLGGPSSAAPQPTRSVPAARQPAAPANDLDDLDALMSSLGGSSAAPAPSRPVAAAAVPRGAPQASVATARSVPAQANNDIDDLDALMSSLGGPAAQPAPARASPAPVRTAQAPVQARAAPANDIDDLDALMSSLGGPSASPARSTPPAAAPVRAAAPANDIDDLEALMSSLGGNSTPNRTPQAQQAAPRNVAPARATPAAASNDLSDLDALMGQLGGATSTPTRSAAPMTRTAAPATATARSMGSPANNNNNMDDLDSLMNQLGGTPTRSAAVPTSYAAPRQTAHSTTTTTTTTSSHSSGSELDDLMASLGGPSVSPHSPAAGRAQSQTQYSGTTSFGVTRGGAPGSPIAGGRGRGAPVQQQQPQSQSQSGGFNSPSAGRGSPYGSGSGVAPGSAGRGAAPFAQPSMGGAGGRGSGLNSPIGSPGMNRRGMGVGAGPSGSTYSPRTPGRYPPSAPGSPYSSGSDLNSLLGSLSEQMSNIDDGNTASRGICGFCQKHILSECIQAMGKTFHPEHFVCFTCEQPLGTNSFYETNGEPNCEKCYQSMYCPICAFCNKAIPDRCVTAMNKKWHVECFVCNSCCQAFPGGSFFEKNGMPYCQNCFQGTFATRCAGCQQVATGRIINALNQQWHQECFACTYCKRPFNGKAFYEKDGKPYCDAHYHAASGAVCDGCKQPVVGRCVDAFGKKYHPEHFICNYCMNPLSGGGYTEQNGQPYCQVCYNNLF